MWWGAETVLTTKKKNRRKIINLLKHLYKQQSSTQLVGECATNKPSEDDCSSPKQPDFHGDQPATSKGKLKKPVAGWMMTGPIQMGPVLPAGATIVIIITRCSHHFICISHVRLAEKWGFGVFTGTCVMRKKMQ